MTTHKNRAGARHTSAVLCGLLVVLAGAPALAQQVPLDALMWGFCQVGGTSKGAVWPLSRNELTVLRDDLHINALRFFVHPAFIGLPQKTWNGPEAIDYTRFRDSDYVWRDPSPAIDSLDEVLDLLRELQIHPVLMVWPVDEYVAYLSRDDLTFLNDPGKGLRYDGIRPVEQVKALTVALARHMHQTYGDDFTLIYTEVAGQGDGAPKRTNDRRYWSEIVASARAAAPKATIVSPELCIGMWWWAAAQAVQPRASSPSARGSGTPAPPLPHEIPYSEGWPRGDRIEHYRDAFDLLAISYYGMSSESIEWKDVAAHRPALAAYTDATLWVARTHARPKRWLWAEAGWGSALKEKPPFHLHRDWAALLFGMDHCRGALLWQAKDNEGSTGGVFTAKGEKTPDYRLLKAVSDVVLANSRFFAADHATRNADGFPIAQDLFREDDPAVLTRFLGRHVVLFSEAPVMSEVTFTRTGGKGLREVPAGLGYSQPWPLTIRRGRSGVTVGQIRPGVLYLLEVVP